MENECMHNFQIDVGNLSILQNSNPIKMKIFSHIPDNPSFADVQGNNIRYYHNKYEQVRGVKTKV